MLKNFALQKLREQSGIVRFHYWLKKMTQKVMFSLVIVQAPLAQLPWYHNDKRC